MTYIDLDDDYDESVAICDHISIDGAKEYATRDKADWVLDLCIICNVCGEKYFYNVMMHW